MNQGRLKSRIRAALTGAAIILPALAVGIGGSPVTVSASTTRLISSSGTTSMSAGVGATSTGGVQNPELPGAAGGDAAAASDTNGANRSNSSTGGTAAGIATGDGNGTIAGSNPELATSFDGLNHFINRFGVNHGNQFSLEPPDQGLCAASGVELETLNDVLAVYNTTGTIVSGPVSLSEFYNYAPAIDRQHGNVRGPFPTDPSCLYDAASQRWFHVILTLETVPANGRFTGKNHLDLAVSKTSDPAGGWNIYRVPAQDDGTDGTPNHHCSGIWYDGSVNNTCLGDYPHIGADANGFYITTNEYSFFGNDFHGAQVYAFSKSALAAGSPTVTVTQIDTNLMDAGNSGFTLAPAQAPPGGAQESAANGTEYFLSSNAADEAHGNGASVGPRSSNQILVWALSNTSSLATATPTLSLKHTTLGVGTYAFPSPSNQKSGPTPLRDCLNNAPCSIALIGFVDPFQEKEYNLDSNDTRMMQTTFAQGQLWGSLDTSLSHSSSKSAGIEWFVVRPTTSRTGAVSASATNTGYLGLPDDNLIYPAIGVNEAGNGVMAFTVVGGDRFPSAGYALINAGGTGTVHVAREGAGPADGFSGYIVENLPNPARPRWGDYGAAAVVGSQVWIASEYIGQTCTLAQYEATGFRCGNTRTALANWDTRISLINP
jgi:hypothetical protein